MPFPPGLTAAAQALNALSDEEFAALVLPPSLRDVGSVSGRTIAPPSSPPPHEDPGDAASVDSAVVSSQEVPVAASSPTQVAFADSDSEPELDWLIPHDETEGSDEEIEHADAGEAGQDTVPVQTAPSDDGPSLPLLKHPAEILGNIADEMDTNDFANLLRVNLQLKKILILSYMKRIGLTQGSSKICIQGEFPLSAIRLLCDLPPFHSSKSSLDCELYFIHHFPAAIAKFLRNQPQIIRVRIRYTERYSIYITHPRLPRALQHTLTSLGPCFRYLDVDSTLDVEPSGRSDLPQQTDFADMPPQISPMDNITRLRWIRLPVSCLIFDPVCQIFLSLLSTRMDVTLLVSGISNAEELNEVLVRLPKSSIGYLALLYIGSERPVVPNSAFLKFTNLHTFWFYHPYFHGIEPVALHLPPLKTLSLTPCFSTISMTNSSTLKELHLTPCSFYDTSVSIFCKQLDDLCQLISLVFRSLHPMDVSLQLDLPSSLTQHFLEAKRGPFVYLCWRSLHLLTNPPIRSVSALRLNMDSPDVLFEPDRPEITSFLRAFRDVKSLTFHVSDFSACTELAARSLLQRLPSEMSAISQLTLGPVRLIKLSNGLWSMANNS